MTEDLPFPEAGLQIEAIQQQKKELTKKTIAESVKKTADSILNEGKEDPLTSYIKIKAMELYLKDLIKLLQPDATEKASNYGKGEQSILGVDFAIAGSGKKYDFSKDTEWNDLNESIDQLKDQIKEREGLLKSISGKNALVDKETGEVLEPPTVLSEGADQLKITFRKK